MIFDKNLNSKILLDLNNFLTQNGIDHFLAFGTLLGAYRDNDYLSADIDIAVDYKDYWKFRNLIDNNTEDWKYNCIWRKEIALWKYERKIDILFYDRQETFTYFYIYKQTKATGRWHNEQRYVYRTEHIFPLQFGCFLNDNFYIPISPEKTFEYYYGKKWETPDPNWNRDALPPENLDTDYRHIAVDLSRVIDKTRWIQHFLQYDQDWIKIYHQKETINEPIIIKPYNNQKIPTKMNLNILLDILNNEEDIDVVSFDENAVLDKKTIVTRSSKGFSYGEAHSFDCGCMIKNPISQGKPTKIVSVDKNEVFK